MDAASSATVATPAPVVTIAASGTRVGTSVMSRRPVTSASQKPEVSVAASFEASPMDSRWDVIHPPVPFSTATYSVNARMKMTTSKPGRPGEPAATGRRPEMPIAPGVNASATPAAAR